MRVCRQREETGQTKGGLFLLLHDDVFVPLRSVLHEVLPF